jgi:hypothetical protein
MVGWSGPGKGCGGDDAVVYNHLFLVPKPATLEGRIKKDEKSAEKITRMRKEH